MDTGKVTDDHKRHSQDVTLVRHCKGCSRPLPPVKVGIKIVFGFSKVISSWSNLVKISNETALWRILREEKNKIVLFGSLRSGNQKQDVWN